jgi:tetratricopeptide (TPR) repeat protein
MRCAVRKSWKRFALILIVPLFCGTGCSSTSSGTANSTATNANPSSWWSNPFASTGKSTSSQKEIDVLAVDYKKDQKLGPDMYIASANMQEKSGNLDGARAQYEKALKENPEHFTVLVEYARMEDRNNRLDPASKLYQRAIAAKPAQASTYNYLGLCYMRMNRSEEAAKTLSKAIELEPTKPLYHNNLAAIYVQMNRTNDALTELKKVNLPAEAHYNVAYLMQRKGDMNGAAQQMNYAVQLEPNFGAARQWLQQYAGSQQMIPPAQVAQNPQQQFPMNNAPVNGYRAAPSVNQAPVYTAQNPTYPGTINPATNYPSTNQPTAQPQNYYPVTNPQQGYPTQNFGQPQPQAQPVLPRMSQLDSKDSTAPKVTHVQLASYYEEAKAEPVEETNSSSIDSIELPPMQATPSAPAPRY